jgi:6-phosphogluconate dehydrogenase
MRNLSGLEGQRMAISQSYGGRIQRLAGERNHTIDQIRRGLYAATILTYAQGFAQLDAASKTYGYNLDLSEVARIWRGGCIIRSKLLEPIRDAYCSQPGLLHLMLDQTLGQAVAERLDDLRNVVQTAARLSIPTPAFMSTLAYIDGLRSSHLPANLIQAQRDFFGAHTYERVDQRGIFHTHWTKEADQEHG